VLGQDDGSLLFCCLSACLCERGRAAGSGQTTRTLLERNDHLSPGDSQGLSYQSKGRKAQRVGHTKQQEMLQKNDIGMHK